MATYYIDLNAGNDANDGLSTGASWLTIEKYTTVTARTAGDIAYVRANTTEIPAASFTCDEDGQAANYIHLIGCNATQGIDPWGDSSDVRPIINFNSTGNQLEFTYRKYWEFKNLSFKNSTAAALYNNVGRGIECENCEFDSNATGVDDRGTNTFIKDCVFTSNTTQGIFSYANRSLFKGCSFDGNAKGIDAYDGCCFLESCSFGTVSINTTCDISIDRRQIIHGRNINLNSTTKVTIANNPAGNVNMELLIEDYGQVKGAHKAWFLEGTIERDTGETTPSGEYAAKMLPFSPASIILPLTLKGFYKLTPAIAIYCLTGVEKTITAKMKGIGWTSFPTNSELYLEAQYLDSGSGGTRTAVQSTQVLSNNTNYVNFTVTFTPSQSGLVYLNVLLGKYAANCGVYVDPKVV